MKTVKTTKPKATENITKAPSVKAPAAKASAVKSPVAARAPRQSAAKKAAPAPAPLAAPAPVVAAPETAPRRVITAELIAERAYILWEQQGCPQGNELSNWLLAESQLKQEIQSFTA